MKIVKVTYEDGTEKSVAPIQPFRKSDDRQQHWKNLRIYNAQFTSFEEEILDNLNEDTVEEYACERFDLMKEDDVEEKDIDDFSDSEIMEEVRSRKLIGGNNSIISEQFITRFSKIIEKENQLLLDKVLTEFEAKLNI